MKRFSLVPLGTALALAGCGGATAPSRHTVTITPSAVEVVSGMSRQFRAVVDPEGSDQTVRWSIAGPGTISKSGLYQAPAFSGNAETDLTAILSATSPTHGVSATARITIPSVATLLSRGWMSFASGDFDRARQLFDEALSTVRDDPSAQAAKAWIDYEQGRTGAAREVWLSAALADDPDALAGLVLTYASADSSGAVVDRGRRLIRIDPVYVFPGDPEYSVSDVRWLVARAALETGDYEETAEQLNVLVPENGLDPRAAGFPEAALALLESIQGTV